jgi:hypothetical protein
MVILNPILCHSLPQIAIFLYLEHQVMRLARRGHEGGGLRTERGGEPGQCAAPARSAGLPLQLANSADANPGPARSVSWDSRCSRRN